MAVTVFSAVLMFFALMLGLLGCAGLVTLSRRLDRLQRRQAYETECMVKGLQALEQQNRLLSERLNSVIDAGQKLAQDLERAANPNDESQATVRTPHRILH